MTVLDSELLIFAAVDNHGGIISLVKGDRIFSWRMLGVLRECRGRKAYSAILP